ncbi:uncharacterized protein BXZ73DRAFT_81805 [Epithele typhae]|uniref:uncharacterized protein n=1 Tax=Epithele typhae TaxID=378194 RepID=UPI0020075E44|nr:uncharacterized protein BXZ73DRAFT_85379 [Epithele typhae]XP_047872372.1 uncharacterized protein BXZ73DRAFT_81805 [Epithele typhae]KAH9904614.1 hypothetical protein BXZ73DRAFT_85379 [Epithele typhae]KAH9913888.1 hypothetical protein BXZ73DRAFT_81805 [Epithele typhae]
MSAKPFKVINSDKAERFLQTIDVTPRWANFQSNFPTLESAESLLPVSQLCGMLDERPADTMVDFDAVERFILDQFGSPEMTTSDGEAIEIDSDDDCEDNGVLTANPRKSNIDDTWELPLTADQLQITAVQEVDESNVRSFRKSVDLTEEDPCDIRDRYDTSTNPLSFGNTPVSQTLMKAVVQRLGDRVSEVMASLAYEQNSLEVEGGEKWYFGIFIWVANGELPLLRFASISHLTAHVPLGELFGIRDILELLGLQEVLVWDPIQNAWRMQPRRIRMQFFGRTCQTIAVAAVLRFVVLYTWDLAFIRHTSVGWPFYDLPWPRTKKREVDEDEAARGGKQPAPWTLS